VLLVEENGQQVRHLRALLEQAKYQVESTSQRDAALRQIAALKPHVLLLGSVEPGDEIALAAAAEIAGIPTLSISKDTDKILDKLKSLLAPHATPKSKIEAPKVVDQKSLDHLAVELVDEISDREEVLDISAKPGEPRKMPRESSSGSDGVTQILGLLEMSKEDDSGVSHPKKMNDKSAERKSNPTVESAGELAASLFALAVSSGKDGPLVTRVAKPHQDTPSGKEDAPLESAIFTPPEAIKEPPPKPEPKPEKSSKTKNLSAEMPRYTPPKAEGTPAKQPKEETRRIFAPNVKDAAKPIKPTPLDGLLPVDERLVAKEMPRLPTPIAALLQATPALTPFPSDLLPLSPTPWSEEPQVVRNARFLHELLLQKESGVVSSRSSGFTRTLSISKGVVLQATSNAPEEQFATILYREGKLTRAQLDELRALGDISSDDVARTIYRKGYARRAELEAARRRYREEIFAGLLEGKCELQNKDVGLPTPQDKPFSSLLIAALRRRLSANEARRLLQDATLAEAACPVCKRESLGLSPQEMSLLQRLNGQMNVSDFIAGAEPDLVLPLLVALEVAGVVQIVERVIHEDEDQQERLLERARIEGKYEEVILADYFSLLGVSKRATLYEIQRAHQVLSQAFHPERFKSPQYADLLPRLEEIQEVLNDALFVLSDEARRASYASQLVE
jgi:hypothetical protein